MGSQHPFNENKQRDAEVVVAIIYNENNIYAVYLWDVFVIYEGFVRILYMI